MTRRTMSEYFDRLDDDKRKQLRAMLGGELGWKSTFRKLSSQGKLGVGRKTFGEDLNITRVWLDFEANAATGWDIPIICAEVK